MNSTVYLFGGISRNSEEKHFQFPDDYTSTVFRKYVGISSNGTVLAVSFDNSLVYHIYCKHTANGYFGFGVLLNGCWVKGQQKMLSVFSDAYVDAVSSGKVLSINDKGAVQCDTYAIKQDEQETTRITERLRSIINTLSPYTYTESLPIIDVSTNPNFIHKLPNNATDNDWRNSIGKYRSQYSIYGDVKSNFSHVLERLQNTIQEKERYIAKCNSLQEEIAKINKQKKQYELVIGLAVAMFVGAMIAIAVISDKNTKIKNQLETIQNNEETIENQSNTISSQTTTINEQTQSISRLNNRVSELENQNETLQSEINIVASKFPMLVSYIEIANTYSGGNIETNYGNSIYSSSSRYLTPRLNYTGLENGSIELRIKWYSPDGTMRKGASSPSDCSFTQEVYVYKGESQTLTLSGWGNSSAGNWSSGTYRLEIWYGSVCLASRKVKVY